jgi:hypothetical protein
VHCVVVLEVLVYTPLCTLKGSCKNEKRTDEFGSMFACSSFVFSA